MTNSPVSQAAFVLFECDLVLVNGVNGRFHPRKEELAHNRKVSSGENQGYLARPVRDSWSI
ncbi:MAG: hypothetical protein ACJ73N_08160 [Bryobacteraceae bacterium]